MRENDKQTKNFRLLIVLIEVIIYGEVAYEDMK